MLVGEIIYCNGAHGVAASQLDFWKDTCSAALALLRSEAVDDLRRSCNQHVATVFNACLPSGAPLLAMLRWALEPSHLATWFGFVTACHSHEDLARTVLPLFNSPTESVMSVHLRPVMHQVALVRLYHQVLRKRLEAPTSPLRHCCLPLEIWLEVVAFVDVDECTF